MENKNLSEFMVYSNVLDEVKRKNLLLSQDNII